MQTQGEKEKIIKYSLDVPVSILGQIQILSAKRKAFGLENRTQKSVFIELIKIGLELIDEPTPIDN